MLANLARILKNNRHKKNSIKNININNIRLYFIILK